ncbi:MAG TPA: hypothetical protein PKM69_06290 [Bacteroidales bacterium]|nr:hypothetical protein [Bacteroidales bacterium]
MQASTILLAAAGIALFYYNDTNESLGKAIDDLAEFWNSADFHFIEKFIELESGFYKKGDFLLYETDNKLGITVITDTTERSPTFSLYPFENVNEEPNMSLCYLYMPDAPDSETAWKKLLWRNPRALEWADINGVASGKRLLGFDFSSKVLARRENMNKKTEQHRFRIVYKDNGIDFSLENEHHFLKTPFTNPLFTHLVLKMILNSHSTLIMGRLGRYEGNVMTFVRASNNKLIDRAIRYIDLILKNKKITLSYSDLAHVLFDMIEVTSADQSIVLATVAEVEKRNKKK